MYSLLIVLIIIFSILLMMVILLQSSKGGGLAGSLGGGQIGTMFGIRRASDILTKSTTILATLIFVLILAINLFFLPGKGKTSQESVIQTGQSTVPPPQIPLQTK
ncbi:MAG: preprotein translocase subunit SecG [Bacteroidota bacterium]